MQSSMYGRKHEMSRVSTPHSTKSKFLCVQQTFVTTIQIDWVIKTKTELHANDGRMKLIDVVLHERERLQQTIGQVVLFFVLVEKVVWGVS